MKLGTLTFVFLVTLSSCLVAADSRAASNELKWYSFDEGMAVGKSGRKKNIYTLLGRMVPLLPRY